MITMQLLPNPMTLTLLPSHTSLLARHSPTAQTYDPYISTLLSDLSSASMPQPQLTYLVFVLAIKPRQYIITSTINGEFDVTKLHFTLDPSTNIVALKTMENSGVERVVLKREGASGY